MNHLIDYYHSPIGLIKIVIQDNNLTKLEFTDKADEKSTTDTPSLLVKQQLKEYFFDGRTAFEISLDPKGTDFQKAVWAELLKIEFGDLTSYKQLAQSLGDVNKIRAAGTANAVNPIPLIIPCHRVIGSNNKLTGYSGGLWRKQWLINHENAGLKGTLFS